MKHLTVKVHPRAKKNLLKQSTATEWEVWLTSPAQENKANLALIAFLAKQLNIHRSQILILNGAKSQIKMIGIREI